MQKFLLDENLSRRLVEKLLSVFEGVIHVSLEGLTSKSDGEIWEFAKKGKYTIITKDNDFFDMSHLFGCPPKVIRLNCGNKTTEHISNLLLHHSNSILEFAASNNCYLEIL